MGNGSEPLMPNSSKRIAIVYLGIVFFAGLALGAAGYRFAFGATGAQADDAPPSPQQIRERMIRHHTDVLDLSDEQVREYDALLDDVSALYDQLWDDVRPKFDRVRDQRRESFFEILTPEQAKKYREHLEERRRRRRERGDRPGQRPPLPALSQPSQR